jgi:molybdopterin synthase catalytic subunit
MTHVSDLEPPVHGDDWLGLHDGVLPSDGALSWATRPDCGAVVVFAGTVRDHAEGRSGVTRLQYEAYDEHVVPKLAEIAAAARQRWPVIGRVVLLHRVGTVPLGEPSVLVVVSAPHRDEAFEAARFAIDTLKESVPIWKREFWDGGDDWGLGAHDLRPAGDPARAESGA